MSTHESRAKVGYWFGPEDLLTMRKRPIKIIYRLLFTREGYVHH